MNQTPQHEASVPVAPDGETKRLRIAVIASSWHREIVASATQAIQVELERSRSPASNIDSFAVPGAFEIPLHASRLAKTGRYDAIIACGLVVNGGIYRHEFVAGAVIDGLMQVQLQTDTPVFSAVLTPRDFHDHDEHRNFFKDHLVKKGTEVARACLATIESLAALPSGRE
jgi:6,7-dimethyl-8-ribityllumazine synthase